MQNKSKVLGVEEMQLQHDFSEKINRFYSNKGVAPRAMTMTFGCQQNESDTELIRGMLMDMGFSFTDDAECADLIILNTCAIRDHAEKRVLGKIGALARLKKQHPDMVVAVCGCMAQQGIVVEKIRKSYSHVNLLFGTHALFRMPQLLYGVITDKTRTFDISGDEGGVIIEGIRQKREKGICASLSIMYGCNNFCSYCIVPYVRGRERSRNPNDIVSEFKELVSTGYKDITLLGQNVNSYGNDLQCGVDFPDLLSMLNEIEGEFQIRFMTSHPKDATKKLFDVMARCNKVCKALHLPVQSGSNMVLEQMNRKYTAEQYLEIVEYARSVMPDITFTSDIIVGFPGENDNDIADTLSLIKKVGYDALFTFIYSRREGTLAAQMPDNDTREVKQARFELLLNAQNDISRKINDSLIGHKVRVLVCGRSDNDEYQLLCRTEGFKLVLVDGDMGLVGSWIDAEVEKCSTWALYGKYK